MALRERGTRVDGETEHILTFFNLPLPIPRVRVMVRRITGKFWVVWGLEVFTPLLYDSFCKLTLIEVELNAARLSD